MRRKNILCLSLILSLFFISCGKNDSSSDLLLDDSLNNNDIVSDEVDISYNVKTFDYSLFDTWYLYGSDEDKIEEAVIFTFNEDLTGHAYWGKDYEYDFSYTCDEVKGVLDIFRDGYATDEYEYGLPDEDRLVLGSMTFYRH